MSVTVRAFAGAIVLAAITGVAGSAAHAQTKQEFNWCIGEDNPTPAQKITGCTAVIQAGKLKGKRLVFTFSNRGVAYYAKPKVAEAAAARIDHADLTALLYAQGYKRSQFIE